VAGWFKDRDPVQHFFISLIWGEHTGGTGDFGIADLLLRLLFDLFFGLGTGEAWLNVLTRGADNLAVDLIHVMDWIFHRYTSWLKFN
jgi:hypothetical protein